MGVVVLDTEKSDLLGHSGMDVGHSGFCFVQEKAGPPLGCTRDGDVSLASFLGSPLHPLVNVRSLELAEDQKQCSITSERTPASLHN